MINRRFVSRISTGSLVLLGLVVARLYFLQMYQGDFLFNKGLQQRYVRIKIPSFRGHIYDRRGYPLALNSEKFSLFITPSSLKNSAAMMGYIAHEYPWLLESVRQARDRHFLWIDRNLSQNRYEKLASINNQDFHFMPESVRYYPCQSVQTIIGRLDRDLHGIEGIEYFYEHLLRGEDVDVLIEKDARQGRWMIDDSQIGKVNHGTSLQLSIDGALQEVVFHDLRDTVNQYAAQSGSVLIMDPDSGEVMVMVDAYRDEPSDGAKTCTIRSGSGAINDCYELGSVFKIFAALAALDEGVTDVDEVIDCEGKVCYLNGFKIENWTEVHQLTFAEVIQLSSNVGIAKVVHRLGDRLYDHLEKLGFGARTGIEFPGEREGFVNHPSQWSSSSLYVMSFGYEIMASLLQLATAFSVIGNGGYAVRPTLLKNAHCSVAVRSRLYDASVVQSLQKILERVGSRYKVKGMRVMGKTGTARCIEDGHYSSDLHRYTFVGMIEQESFRRVIVTFIDRPEKKNLWASQVAAPLFQKVAERCVVHELTMGTYRGDVNAFSI